MERPFLSICTIFRDEERFLPEFLDVFEGFGDELILVDTGSQDSSLQILQERGQDWHSFQWINDFSAARNYSLSLARGKWIFVADVDDRITKEFARDFKTYLRNTEALVLSLNYCSTNNLDWNGPHQIIKAIQPRVMAFRNGLKIEYRNPVHETPIPSIEEANAAIEKCPFSVFHIGYAHELQAQKNERNRKMIMDSFNSGDRSPRTVLNYVLASWKSETAAYGLLIEAFEGGDETLTRRLVETIYVWLLDFGATVQDDYNLDHEIAKWEDKLRSLYPDALILELREARENFGMNEPQKALQSYRRIYDGIAGESTLLRYRSEILYRIGFLFAVIGDFGSALTFLIEHRHEFGKTAKVFHQILKILIVQGRVAEAVEEFKDLPADLGTLPLEKATELKKIAMALNVPDQGFFKELVEHE